MKHKINRIGLALGAAVFAALLLLCIFTEAMNPGCTDLDACSQEERVA